MKQLALLISCFSACWVYGQNTLRPNIYFQNMNYYNPASGLNDTAVNYHVSLYGKHKFVENEVWNKPTSIFLNHLGRIPKISSFYSASYIYDSYSFYDRHTIYAGYTYQWKLPKTNRLNIGIRGVFNIDHVRWDQLPYIGNTSNSSVYFTPDIDIGVQYQVKGLTLGVSSKNLLANFKRIDDEVLLKNQRELYVNASYAFNIKQKLVIAPYVLVQVERKLGIDLGVYLALFNRVNFSYLFRLLDFRHVYSVGANVFKGLHLGISVDHSSLYRDINLDFLVGYNF